MKLQELIQKHTSKKRRVIWVGTDTSLLERCAYCMRRQAEFRQVERLCSLSLQAATNSRLVMIFEESMTADIAVSIARIRKIAHIPVLCIGSKDYDCGADLLISADLSAPQIAAYATALIYQYEDAAEWWECDGNFPVVSGDFFVDQWNHWASVCGRIISLDKELCSILTFFLRNTFRLISYQELVRILWFNSGAYGQDEQFFIDELRLKIEPDPKHPVYIRDVSGVGYRFINQK